MVDKFPLEILINIFRNVKERDKRQCLLVNRLWNRAAQLLTKKILYVKLTEKSTLYQDLLKYPHLAARVVKITISSNDILHGSLVISLCPNVLHLKFYNCKPEELIQHLVKSEVEVLPRIQQITGGPENYDERLVLWPLIWKHRKTITRVPLVTEVHPFVKGHAKDVYEFIAQFPRLQILLCLKFRNLNLCKLLSSCGENLQSVRIRQAFVYGDNRVNLYFAFPAKLEEFVISYGGVHPRALRFLAENLTRMFVCRNFIMYPDDRDEKIDQIVRSFPDVIVEDMIKKLGKDQPVVVWKKYANGIVSINKRHT